MSAEPFVIVDAFVRHVRSLGLSVFIDPLPVDVPTVGLRISFSGAAVQGTNRERISLDATLSGRGIDPGKFLGKIMAHSRILSGLLERGFDFPLSSSLTARAEIRLITEGRFTKEEAEDKYDWIFQAYYRCDISYNPAVLDHPELAG